MAKIKLVNWISEFYPEYLGINSYPAAECAPFCKVADQWGIFGNFAPVRLVVDGVEFSCSEKLFQMMKFRDVESLKAIYAKNGQALKMNAKHWVSEGRQREDWCRYFVDAMKFCLVTKYQQSEDFRHELEASKGKYIIEDQTTFRQPANTWGAKREGDYYVGPNLLGRLLMELRDNGTLDYTLPEDALDFIRILKKVITHRVLPAPSRCS